jgi:hypothetical protein
MRRGITANTDRTWNDVESFMRDGSCWRRPYDCVEEACWDSDEIHRILRRQALTGCAPEMQIRFSTIIRGAALDAHVLSRPQVWMLNAPNIELRGKLATCTDYPPLVAEGLSILPVVPRSEAEITAHFHAYDCRDAKKVSYGDQ